MIADVKRAARRSPAARETAFDAKNDTADRRHAQAGKWLAVFAYCHGAASLHETAAEFIAHPSWRSA